MHLDNYNNLARINNLATTADLTIRKNNLTFTYEFIVLSNCSNVIAFAYSKYIFLSILYGQASLQKN